MVQQRNRIVRRLMLIYGIVISLGTMDVCFNNIVIEGRTLTELWKFNIKGVLVGDLVVFVMLCLLTLVRLRLPIAYLNGREEITDQSRAMVALLRFPKEMFWGMIGLCLLFSVGFHILEQWYLGFPWIDFAAKDWLVFLHVLLSEQSLALTLALLLYIGIHKTVRAYLSHFRRYEALSVKPSSFLPNLMLTLIAGFLIETIHSVKYVMNMVVYDRPIKAGVFLAIAAFYMCFAGGVILTLAVEFRRDLVTLVGSIRALLDGGRARLLSPMPVIANHEVGQLVAAFNLLQHRTRTEYDDLEKELALARVVQLKLLPPAIQQIGCFRIAAFCAPAKDVGGDLYDVVALEDGRVAVLIGDVSGNGMSAALMLSAMFVVFRTEIRRGGSSGEVLSRLNDSMFDALQTGMIYTLGLAIFDADSDTVDYASAGHMPPIISGPGHIVPTVIEGSSFPIGVERDIVYRCERLTFQPGDELILYTDGFVEALDDRGEMVGFERLESILKKRDPEERGLEERLDWLISQFPQSAPDAVQADDRTMLIVRRKHPVEQESG